MLLKTLFSAAKQVQRLGSLTVKPVCTLPKSSIIATRGLLNCFMDRSYSSNTSFGRLSCSGLLTTNSLLSSVGLLQPKPVTLGLERCYFINRKKQNIKFSKRKGKRQTIKVVLHKFYRLDWGCWIHGKCGRAKSLYRKSAAKRRRLHQHVMCNASQSWLLDKMVSPYWRKPKYYVDDPYEPYHSREEFKFTRKKPWQPPIIDMRGSRRFM